MYFRSLLLSGCVALVGCQSAPTPEYVQESQVEQITSLAELQSAKVKLPSTAIIEITNQSQYLSYQNIDGPVAVFELPANRGEYALEITSIIEDTAFVPRAVIVDKAGNVIEQYGRDEFVYTKPRLNKGNRLVADKDFFPPVGEKSVYLIVYGDKSDLGGFTDVIHPARLDAEGRGNYLPEAKDIPVPNALTGKIEVSIDSIGFFSIGTAPSNTQQAEPSVSSANIAQAPIVEVVQPETQTYYHNAIESAVKANNLDKALSLLEEAKALNVEGAQQVFIKAVNAK
ncbi:MalM family protein [Vibrio sinaloensis]|uniref:MalM family protein n=1 Tax=Photobacterium sp. (strain ATCC 43367) TaxID=379097 RepID=UPI00204852D7|nr:MalM family protein [Vibrio sinaloensis]UPQ89538.1 MalM family protein [Vibrio sinaloensis]